jgi:uncharacterized protein (DUF433 family)
MFAQPKEVSPTATPKILPLPAEDGRVRDPLFNLREAALYLDIPSSTFNRWARPVDGKAKGPDGWSKQPLVYVVKPDQGEPRVPFVGLAEDNVLRAFRESGVPLQRIRPALARLEQEIGIPYALASERLYTDGFEILFDYAEAESPELYRALTVVRSGQKVLTTVLEQYLRRMEFDAQQWPSVITLPVFRDANVVVDVHRAFGRPLVMSGFGARVDDVVDRWVAGESIQGVSKDFGLSIEECDDIIRVAYRPGRQPRFFIDRSLGGLIVPAALRAADCHDLTIAEIYGEQQAQQVSDVEWLRLAGNQGWSVLLRGDLTSSIPSPAIACRPSV